MNKIRIGYDSYADKKIVSIIMYMDYNLDVNYKNSFKSGDDVLAKELYLDSNLKELMEFPDNAFPFGIWQDDFNETVGQILNYHWHETIEMNVLIKGRLDYRLNDQRFILNEGDSMIVYSNSLHGAALRENEDSAEMLTIVFSADILTGGVAGTIYQKYFQSLSNEGFLGKKFERDSTIGQEMSTALIGLAAIEEQAGYELRILAKLSLIWEKLFLHLLDQEKCPLTKRPEKYEKEIKAVMTYIQQNYMERITIQTICEFAGISRSECFRIFARFTQKKPIEYINDYRMSLAVALMLNTNWTVDRIAQECGFKNASYFGKLFKDRFNQTPKNYRINQRKEERSIG
ncbi:AraC family transcriptional regulator [Enterococcus sp. AZ186]|uniref:AraC family transcriptional regulator n=2 Tax=Enterococcus TaxID=1350 RepID=UPI003F6888F1